jgi:hypothetical protein
MTINIVTYIHVLVSLVVPFTTFLVIEAVIIIELGGISCIIGDFYIPIAWSTEK